ncbi:MAG: hypothetical protein JSS88_01935 [Actinobacteria bacterium]|uniref:EF-Tu/IF-2/RF-3 family GTPase n=1 Tax=Microbacterium sp. USTB-Y TaxID=2823692 RepID=UPI001DBC33FB|nr:EF-Tu/IF-2/RF-3 family GTPase [Microbacterium sp. USTB-Y]MBS1896140.1 hypothetical protein [Actinomycetota bacterium]
MGWFGKKKDPLDANEMLRRYNAQEAERLAAAGIAPSAGIASVAGTVSTGGGSEFVVEDVFTITGRGQVATGRTTTGAMRTGDRVVVLRGSAQSGVSTITGIEMFRKKADEAPVGVAAGLLLKPSVDLARGDVIRVTPTA